jgi:transcriptional regulator with XRE-family HTH domain
MSGTEIRRRRAEMGLRQLHLARQARVDNGALCRTEHGQLPGLSPAALARVAAVLDRFEARAAEAAASRQRALAILKFGHQAVTREAGVLAASIPSK